jgi:hypothetical protein
MTIGSELAFIKAFVKIVNKKFPMLNLDGIVSDLDKITHSPAYLHARMRDVSQKWNDFKDKLSNDEVQEVYAEAGREYEYQGYNLTELKTNISNPETSFLGDVTENLPDTDVGDMSGGIDIDVPGDTIDTDIIDGIDTVDIDGETGTSVFEWFFDMLT